MPSGAKFSHPTQPLGAQPESSFCQGNIQTCDAVKMVYDHPGLARNTFRQAEAFAKDKCWQVERFGKNMRSPYRTESYGPNRGLCEETPCTSACLNTSKLT